MNASLLNPGWLHSVLRARGLPLLPVEVLREGVAQLRPEQVETLRRACMALQSGTDSVAQMSCVADFVRCCRPEHGEALQAAGLAPDVGALLAALEALGGQALFGALRALPDSAAREQLRPYLAPLAAAALAGQDGGFDDDPGPDAEWPDAEPLADEAPDGPPWQVMEPPPSSPASASPAYAPAPATPPARVLPRGHHVYGAKAALRVEEDRWRTDDPVRCHTLRLEVAPALAERRYDWEHKIAVQLTARELPSFAAVLLNLLPQLQAQGHGFSNDKWFEVRRQAGSVLVRVGQGRRGCAVPVAAGDLYDVTLLALDALRANAPQADTAQVMAALQALAG
ncbi:hypothetical protein [Azohydromonas caseinilytica]|uniref:Uncharacterized protein n=1 Tax=Azohydromonas caseinilytica TaxID=2728836 RepID=A0A848FBA8_9BURK|nr:hypothetical protein [Azohydromonas caseinilytica]NML16804.1 hypothetical protein [Azohydromonas caseinilytica]